MVRHVRLTHFTLGLVIITRYTLSVSRRYTGVRCRSHRLAALMVEGLAGAGPDQALGLGVYHLEQAFGFFQNVVY